jgi:hypothetical protein
LGPASPPSPLYDAGTASAVWYNQREPPLHLPANGEGVDAVLHIARLNAHFY